MEATDIELTDIETIGPRSHWTASQLLEAINHLDPLEKLEFKRRFADWQGSERPIIRKICFLRLSKRIHNYHPKDNTVTNSLTHN